MLLTLLALWYVQHLKFEAAMSRALSERTVSSAEGKRTEALLNTDSNAKGTSQGFTGSVEPAESIPLLQDIPLENGIESWIAKVRLLTKYANKHPEWQIRQMDLLDEDDWLNATRGRLESEADFRTALGSLRFFARKKTAAEIGSALKTALQDGLTLSNPRDLLPYLPSGFDPAILDQMQVNGTAQTTGQVPLASPAYLLVDRPVNRWDPFFMFGADGNWAARSNTPSEQNTISNAIRDYTKSHGSLPDEFSQLKDYPDMNRYNEQDAREVFGALMTEPEL